MEIEVFFAFFVLYLLSFVFGAVVGSFLNVVIYRGPKGNFFEEKYSYCPQCKTRLKALDLVPIASYVALGAKCRYCKTSIKARYPMVELITGLLAMLSFHKFSVSLETLIVFLVLAVLLCLAYIDIDTMEIPDSFHVIIGLFAVMMLFVRPEVGLFSRAVGAIVISVPMLILATVIENAFGGGDIKLMFVSGFMLGTSGILLAFFVALLVGGIQAINLLYIKKKSKKEPMAFGPALCVGIGVAILYAPQILSFYFNLFY